MQIVGSAFDSITFLSAIPTFSVQHKNIGTKLQFEVTKDCCLIQYCRNIFIIQTTQLSAYLQQRIFSPELKVMRDALFQACRYIQTVCEFSGQLFHGQSVSLNLFAKKLSHFKWMAVNIYSKLEKLNCTLVSHILFRALIFIRNNNVTLDHAQASHFIHI